MTRNLFPLSRLARYEFRRFRGPLPKIALIFVALIPVLYGAIYLTANWDPYGKLDRLPVAVVDADTGTTYQGKEIHAGRDFVDSLVAKRTFDWHQVDAGEADRGLRAGDYYLVVTVPAGFSADLVSGAGDDPRRAKITIRRDDANGFVVGSITNSAQNSIARAVDESAEASYFDAVFANLKIIRNGISDAATGAGKLAEGTTSARDGAAKLDTGAAGLARGLTRANTGATQLAAGLNTLDTRSGDLAGGAAQVAAGTQKLDNTVVPPLKKLQSALPELRTHARDASSTLSGVADAAAGRTSSVASDLDQATTALARLKADHPEVADDPNYTTVTQAVDTAAGRADGIATATRKGADAITVVNDRLQGKDNLSAEISTITGQLDDLNDGAHQVSSGAARLHTAIGTASRGADTLATGISAASAGAHTLATGAHTLHTGLTTLASGAATLRDGLTSAVQRIPTPSADEQAEAVQVLASPADVLTTIDHPATYYGRGLAPMFFSIALWVFGISVFLVVRPITARALAGRAGALRLALTGWLPVGVLAAVGGLLMVGTVWLGLGLDPVHPALTILLVIVASVCFSAIAHLLRTALGTPGSSLLLVLLILQLTSAGGTYPAPLLPAFFATIGHAMPMTYLIDAFRVVISGGQTAHLARDLLILTAVAIAALAACALVVRRRQQFRMRDLHPPLIAP